MSVLTHNMHVRTYYSYYQAYTNAIAAQHYLLAHNVSTAPLTEARAAGAVCETPRWVTVLPEISNNTKPQRMRASVGRYMSYNLKSQIDGCICVFCEHKFTQEMYNVHQVERRARGFCNDTIHGDYCMNCLQSGGIMRLFDVNGQDLGAIRELLVDLINEQTLAVSIKSVISS